MSDSLYSKLLTKGSLLLPEVSDPEIDTVVNFVNKTSHPPILAIIKEISQLSFQVQSDYYHKQKQFTKQLKFGSPHFNSFLIGFRTPLIVVYNCYKQSVPLFDFSITPRSSDQYIQKVILKFRRQIAECKNQHIASTITRLFTHCEKHPFLPDDEHYTLGVVASLTTFREFLTQIKFKRSK